MINLVTFPGRKQRGRRSGRILSKVLISRMVLRRLSARHVGRYLLTLSCGLVAVVHLLFGVMLSTRNVVAQKLVKDSCRNLLSSHCKHVDGIGSVIWSKVVNSSMCVELYVLE